MTFHGCQDRSQFYINAKTMIRNERYHRATSPGLHWALIPLLAGILIGVAFSTVFLLQPYTAVTNVYLELPSPERGGGGEPVPSRLGENGHLQRLLNELGTARHSISGSPAKLADEANARGSVHYSIVMSHRHSAEQLKVLKDTWTRDIPSQRVSYYIQSEEKERQKEEHDDEHYGEIESSEGVIELASTGDDFYTDVVAHMCRNTLNHTKWYLLAGDDVYVKSQELEAKLQKYENLPTFGYLGRRSGEADSGGGECAEGPGVALSHSAFSQLCGVLDSCRKRGEGIGGCLTKTLGQYCNELESEGLHSFLLIDTDLRSSVTDKTNAGSLHSALTLSPVPDTKTMYGVHQGVVGSRLNATQHKMHTLKWALDRMSELLPSSSRHTLAAPSVQGGGSDVVSVDDIVSWKLVDREKLLSDDEFTPTRDIPGVWKSELDAMMDKSVQYVSTKEDTQLVFKRVVNAYWRVNPMSAIHCIIDFETSRPQTADDKPQANRYRITFSRPLNPPEISHTLPPVEAHVKIVVCFTSEYVERLQGFLHRLESTLDRDQRVSLVAVQMRSGAEKQKPWHSRSTVDPKSLFSLYHSKYQMASFTLLESPALLSRSHAISITLRESRPSEILFLADLDLHFDEAFLERCRSLPLQGQQTYFPIVFSLRNPALLTSLNHSLIEGSVSQHTGHWMVNSYSVACAFAADILTLSSQSSEAKGVLNEVDMEEVYSALLEKGYEMIRAPDKALKKGYNDGSPCDLDLIGLTVGEACVAPADSDEPQYLQTQLSALLFDHEGENSANKY